MAARLSLAALIGRLREMIADPAGAFAVFSDDRLSDALDAHRTDVRYLELAPLESYAPGGAVRVLGYAAPLKLGDWEEDAALFGPAYDLLDPELSDCIAGVWTFTAHTPGPVRLVGKSFDLAASAADLLEAWASSLKREYDLRTGDQVFNRSDQVPAMLDLARNYRRRARARVARLDRRD